MNERSNPEVILKETLTKYVCAWLFEFLGIDAKKVQVLPVELPKRIRRVSDLLFDLGDKVLHIELQTRRHKKMIFRMLQYWLLIYQEYTKPVRQLVVYLTAKVSGDDGELVADNLHYSYQVLDICSIDENVFLDTNTGEQIILCLLAKKKNKYQTVQKMLEKLSQLYTDVEELAIFVEDAMTFARMRSLDKILTQQLKQMPSVFKINKQKDAMYLEGKLEGKLEGERLAKLETAQRMLTMNLPIAIITAATGLSESEVIELSKASNK